MDLDTILQNHYKYFMSMTNKDKRMIVQDYLYSCGEDAPILNINEELASKVFAGAIGYATAVFANNLVLGGKYNATKNCQEIIDCLQKLNNLIA